ncbi:MAG: carbamate kinase [Alphaproteobacteria bacterium]
MRLVVAVGGNALLQRGEALTAENQRRNLDAAARSIAELAAHHEVVVVHGNGPQVGLLALEAEAFKEVPAYPLDILGAESQGMIGYMFAQALGRYLPEREIICVMTRTLVDPGDPAFTEPSKPIGPVYPKAAAEKLAAERGWTVAPDGTYWRRVVPSPEPKAVLEQAGIATLAEQGAIVICAGGGGVPVRKDTGELLRGVEGVVDKDKVAALLACELAADGLIILTDVDGVYAQWGTPDAVLIPEINVDSLQATRFAAGSMQPKIDACCSFVRETGREARIGPISRAAAVFEGRTGTVVRA